ncbi:MAG: ParA family protein [Gammaproteobacteria bacterium]
MKVIAAVSNKGGVGKTKLSALLTEYLAKYTKKKVLAIDFDPQCNFSLRYLPMEMDPAAPEGLMPPIHPDYNPDEDEEWDGRSSIADIFFGQGVVPYPTFIKNVDIAPGHAERLLAAEMVRRSEVAERIHRQLKIFLNSPDLQEAYDVVIVDTAPSKGPLTVSVIKAATDIVIPSVMEEQPIQGIYGMLQLWMQESFNRKSDNPLNLVGILPNMFKNTTLHRDMYESLLSNEGIGKYMMPMKISQRIVYAEIDSEDASPRTIFDLPDNHIAKREAVTVCEYIMKEVFG